MATIEPTKSVFHGMPQSRPKRGTGPRGGSSSTAYDQIGSDFNAIGKPIPVVLGEARVDGIQIHSNTIQSGSKGVFKGVFVFSEGPIKDITNIRIEGKPVEAYETLELNKQLGRNNSPIPFIDRNVLETDSSTTTLSESQYPNNPEDATTFSPGSPGNVNVGDFVVFTLTFPDGLYKNVPLIQNGSILQESAKALFKVESKSADGTWVTETSQIDDAAAVNERSGREPKLWWQEQRPRNIVEGLPVKIQNRDWNSNRDVRIRRVWQPWQRGDSSTLFVAGQNATTAKVTEVSWETENSYSYDTCAVLGVKLDLAEIDTEFPQVDALVKGLVTVKDDQTIDDFEDDNITEYTEGGIESSSAVSWSTTTTAHDGSHGLKAAFDGSSAQFDEDLTSSSLSNLPERGDTFDGWLRADNTDADDAYVWVLFAVDTSGPDYYRLGLKINSSDDETLILEKVSGGSVVKDSTNNFASGQDFGSWYRYEVRWNGSVITAEIYDSTDTKKATVSIDDDDYDSGDFGHAAGAVKSGGGSSTIDDFESGDLTDYTEKDLNNTGNVDWNNQTGTVKQGSNAAEASISKTDGDGTDDQREELLLGDSLGTTPERGDKFEGWIRMTENDNASINENMRVSFGIQSDFNDRYRVRVRLTNDTDLQLQKMVDESVDVSSSVGGDGTDRQDTWLKLVIDWDSDGSGNITATLEESDGTSIDSVTLNDTTWDSGDFGLEARAETDLDNAIDVDYYWDDWQITNAAGKPTVDLFWDSHIILKKNEFTNKRTELINEFATKPKEEGGYGMDNSVFDSTNESNVQSHLDASVNDGEGDTEPRDQMDLVVDNEMAFEQFMNLATTPPSINWYGDNSGIRYYADKSGKTSQMLFTERNILKDGDISSLNVEPKAREQQFNSLSMEYVDESLGYDRNILTVQKDGTASKRPQEKRAHHSVTRRSQVKRDARLMLRTMKDEDKIYTLDASMMSIPVQPGDVCWICHDKVEQTRGSLSGMVTDFGDDWVATDKQITMQQGETYKLCVLLEDNTTKRLDIDNEDKRTNIFTLSSKTFSNIGSDPLLEGPASVGIDGEDKKDIRILETEERNDGTLAVMATEHDETKYTDVDSISVSKTEAEKDADDNTPKAVNNLTVTDASSSTSTQEASRVLRVEWDLPSSNVQQIKDFIIWKNSTDAAQEKAKFDKVAAVEGTSYETNAFIEGNKTQFVVQTRMKDESILDFSSSPIASIESKGSAESFSTKISPDTDSDLDQLSLSSSGTTITYSDYDDESGNSANFSKKPDTVNVENFSNSNAVRYTLSNLSDTSVDIQALDSSGSGVSSDADITVTE